MNTRLKKRYYLIPLVHLGIIALVLFLQFSGTGSQFSASFGDTLLTGSGNPGRDGGVSSLILNYGGMQLDLSRAEAEGTFFGLRWFDVNDQEVFLHYEGGLVLELARLPGENEAAAGGGEVYAILPAELPEGMESGISFGYSFSRDQSFRRIGVLPAYEFRRGQETFLLSLTPGGSVDASAGKIGSAPALGEAFLSVEAVAAGDLLSYWFFGTREPVSQQEYSRVLSTFIDRAYSGWRTSRFNRQAGTWSRPGRSAEFNEKTAAALIAEAYNRGDYDAVSMVQAAAEVHSRAITHVTAPYFGDIVTTDALRRQAEASLIRSLSSKALSADFEIFTTVDLLSYVAFSRSQGLVRDLNGLAGKIDPSASYSAAVRVGLAEAYLDSVTRFPDQFQPFSQLYPDAVEDLLPHIRRTAQGLFLHERKARVDSVLSLRAGLVLQRIGEREQEELYEAIGREMVLSVLNLGNEAGFVPEFYESSGEEPQLSDTLVSPEELYSHLAAGPFYPRLVSMKGELDRDIEVWTAAESVIGRVEGNSLIFDFTFPEERIHHFVLRGVQPFDHIFMFGIRWNGDRRFQAYFSGWFYDSATLSLYVKLRHRQGTEQLVINY